MSGDRIFAEVIHQRRLFPSRTHLDFYDLTANGHPVTLSRFADLTIHYRRYCRSSFSVYSWKINAVIRPEMTAELLMKLRTAGCKEIIYGIESGSPALLKKMNKHYDVRVADEVLRDTHRANIMTVGNFMFGFPGETEDDFQMTLDFLRRNSKSMDKAYASATFASLEENSYLTDHQESFGVRREADKEFHCLYWETVNGDNTYLVRLDRYRRFRKLAIELGLEAYRGVNGSLELEHQSRSAQFYRYTDDRLKAVGAYIEYLKLDPGNSAMRMELQSYMNDLQKLGELSRRLEEIQTRHAGVEAAAQAKIWDLAHGWFTDDKVFEMGQIPDLRDFVEGHPSCRPLVSDLISFHAELQKLDCHGSVRWDGGRFVLAYGSSTVDASISKMSDESVRLLRETAAAVQKPPDPLECYQRRLEVPLA